jgi:hypothetical protein
MTQLFQTKSMLGRLLATENLTIVHGNVPTAYFDLKNRTIMLPKFKEMTGELYDLLVGHEVSHALNTPAEGWHDAVVDDPEFKTYLNVIEDARIERKIKIKYPGIRRSFNAAYKKLHDDDFFGIAAKDVNKMLLIDRINIFYKLGAHVRVSFAEDELPYIDEINAAETWEQVVEVARKIYNKTKEDLENKKSQMPSNNLEYSKSEQDSDGSDSLDQEYDQDDADDQDSDGSDSLDQEYGQDDADDQDGDEGEDGDQSENEDDENSESAKPANKKGTSNSFDISSQTDKTFRQNETRLLDDSSGKIHIFTTPIFNGKHIVPYKIVQHHITIARNNFCKNFPRYKMEEKIPTLIPEFNKRTNNVVNYMVKEFEIRKNASQMTRSKIGKSGKINPNKLARYTMVSDIFKKTTITPGGKNHGLVMFIDLSGSMSDIISNVFEQVIILTRFCKKVNIPFEVYGFSDLITGYRIFNNSMANMDDHGRVTHGLNFEQVKGVMDLSDTTFHLKHYLSSSMSSSDYREAVLNMLYVSDSYRGYCASEAVGETEGLGGTPLDEAVVASMDIVENFKNSHRLDNVNCIFLTDGEGGLCQTYFPDGNDPKNPGRRLWVQNNKDTIYIENQKTKHRVRVESRVKNTRLDDMFRVTRALVELAKMQTNAKYTGYYLAHKKHIAVKLEPYMFSYATPYSKLALRSEQFDARKILMKRIEKDGFISSDQFGFDEYFLLQNTNLKVTENTFEVEGNRKNSIARSFIKHMKGRGLQRMFLNQFMQNIAA